MPRVVTLTFVDSDDNYGDDRFKADAYGALADFKDADPTITYYIGELHDAR